VNINYLYIKQTRIRAEKKISRKFKR
jgi:hypothetical protein